VSESGRDHYYLDFQRIPLDKTSRNPKGGRLSLRSAGQIGDRVLPSGALPGPEKSWIADCLGHEGTERSAGSRWIWDMFTGFYAGHDLGVFVHDPGDL
jgi:hypothetical protein